VREILFCLLAAVASICSAASDEARAQAIAEQLRCLVCQNQTIADSDAPLALDLRAQVRAQLAQGRSDAQVIDFMVARYGDFVLYRPPVKPMTFLLWFGPLLLLAGGLTQLYRSLRKQEREGA
jgi:cytochrome c-type biogenesis protein CcmH